jgi:excisionase family DNA binding protein
MSDQNRDVLTPREVAERSGFSYHAILRAIRRGDLQAFEPVPGHYRISIAEFERWLHTPARSSNRAQTPARGEGDSLRPRSRRGWMDPSDKGSFARLSAIEGVV